MKSLIKVAGLVVLCGLLIFFGAQLLFTQETKQIKPIRPSKIQDTTLRLGSDSLATQETYVSKVILQAPWAKKNLVYSGEESPPGQFGVYQYVVPESLKEQVDAGLPEGPTSFTIAPNGDIYITDPLNYRIQRFSPNGQFISAIPDIKVRVWYWRCICVDRNKGIYLLLDELSGTSVRKYNQSGNLMTTYPVLGIKGVGRASPEIFCDTSGALMIRFIYSGKEGGFIAVFQIATVTEPLGEQQQKGTFRRANVNSSSFVDGSGATYVESTLQDSIDQDRYWTFLKKYDLQKNLIATIKWQWRVGGVWGPFVPPDKLVDKNGSIYLYCSTKEGITITKWYKQP